MSAAREKATMKHEEIERAERPLRHEGHRKPVTRRDFLAQGLISGGALVAAPSLLGLVARSAWAQAADCGITVGGAGLIPFLALDLAGGASVAGSNVLVGGPGGQLDLLSDDGYRKLGLPASMTPRRPGQVDSQLGLLFHADSPFLAGIVSKTGASTRQNTNGVVFCARSENDTDNNPHNPMYGINKAGANGEIVALVGSRASDSGGNSRAPMSMFDPTVRPTKVDSSSDASGLVDVGKLTEILSGADAAAVMGSVQRISDLKVQQVTQDAVLRDLLHCSYFRSTDKVVRFGNPAVLDAEADPLIAGAGGIFSAAELDQGRFRKTAAVMKLVVDGFAGAGTIENGGYDYHDSTRATGEVRDFLAGQMMGACLEFAARRGLPLVLYVFSDGSVGTEGDLDETPAGRGKFTWKGDDSSTSATFMLVYNPAGRPQWTRPDAGQIGFYRMNGSVETAATRVSNQVDLLAEAVVLNYLALHNDVGRLAQVLPRHGLGSGAELDRLVAFQPIRATPTG
jgi:hypothetical protein